MQAQPIPISFNNKNTVSKGSIFCSRLCFPLFALASSFININYDASIIVGAILLGLGLFTVLVKTKSLLTQRLFYLNLIYAFVSMDLPPFSEEDWSSFGAGSGFINTPLTKVFYLYLIIWALSRKSIFSSLFLCGFGLLSIIILESINYYSFGAASNTWLSILILLVLGLSFKNAIFCGSNNVVFEILKYSVIAIGIRSLFFLIGNYFGFNDYLTYGQKPIIGWVFIIYCIAVNYKLNMYLLMFALLTVIPVGKVEYFYFLFFLALKPSFFLISLIGLATLLIYGGNVHLLLKLSEILSILSLDSAVDSINVLSLTGDAGSLGVRIGEFLAIINAFIERPYSILIGLNGYGISIDNVRDISGELSRFDYTESEFSKNTIINTHGFYNKLLYSTGLIGLILYFGIVYKLIYSLSKANFLTNLSALRKSLLFGILVAMLLLEVFYKPEIFMVLSIMAAHYRKVA